ncbi:MAG: 3-dehydroquinate synthase, partial [Planctomycetota bacterium]
ALGMAMAARLSVKEGHCGRAVAERLEALLHRDGLPTRLAALPFTPSADALLTAMGQDKKVESGAITLILLQGLGDAFIARDQDTGALLDFLKDEGQLPAL